MTRVSPEQFVKVWQKAKSVSEVAEKFNMTTRGVCSRAATYRKKYKVPLQKFHGGVAGPRIDVEGLIRLAGGKKTTAAKSSKKVSRKKK